MPHEAFGLLRDLSHHTMPCGETVLTTWVRDAGGAVIFRATMTIVSDWTARVPD